MHKPLLATLIVGLTATSAFAGEIVNDDFSFEEGVVGPARLDRTVWTTGGGFLVTDNETLLISSFGGNWGNLRNIQSAANNAAPLNSQTGYASLDVLPNGEIPLEGNFLISTTDATNTANAIFDVRFGDGTADDGSGLGSGSYELLWNNSGTSMDFSLPSGFTGTIAGNSNMIVKDGDTENPMWGQTDGPANVNVGDNGMAYHFWVNVPNQTMIVDNVVIWDSIPQAMGGLSADFNTDGIVDLLDLDILGGNWQMAGTSATGDANGDGVVDLLDLDLLGAQWQQSGSFAAALAASGIAVPEPASAALIALGGALMIRRRRA